VSESAQELALLCREGDARAWERIVRAHQERILNLAYQFTGNREEARDLAQEVFVRLYQKLDQYDPARPFATWLNRLARNVCIDHYRQRRRDRCLVDTPVEEFGSLAAATAPPDRRLEARDRRELILRALDGLGEISREAIVLKDLQEMSIEEICRTLGLPEGTVKSRIFRARIELGRQLLRLQGARGAAEGCHGL
jgi:RNA polymerase sigma-70 factor (ECF subfamily)